MTRFISREKLSKKARKELDAQRRAIWPHSPVTRKIESKKRYSRKKKSHARFDENGMGFCFSRTPCRWRGILFSPHSSAAEAPLRGPVRPFGVLNSAI